MEVRSYNAELAIANLQFKRLFSNIIIERTTKNGNVKQIPVTCVLAQRSRIIKNWENTEKRGNIKLPMITINRTGYTRNGDRLNNLHNEVKYEITSKNRSYDLLTPVPIDISYEVTIIAKYPSDIDQIASNFMVFFNSDAYVQCMHPKYEGIVLNNQVIMDDSVSEEHPVELESTTDDFITSTFTFKFKTYLFGGYQKAKLVPTQIISSYISSFISSTQVEIKAEDIDQFQKDNPDVSVYALSSSEITAELTTYVNNPDTSSTIYDGFTPIIKSISVGFYPVPFLSDFSSYINTVDNEYPLSTQHYYVDRLVWKIDENSIHEFPNNVIFNG